MAFYGNPKVRTTTHAAVETYRPFCGVAGARLSRQRMGVVCSFQLAHFSSGQLSESLRLGRLPVCRIVVGAHDYALLQITVLCGGAELLLRGERNAKRWRAS